MFIVLFPDALCRPGIEKKYGALWEAVQQRIKREQGTNGGQLLGG